MKNKIKDNIQKSKVLVIGDLMLDKFTYGDVLRISPEAPVPVLHVNNEKYYLGGAGNVARNIASLLDNKNNNNIALIGVVGDDKSASMIRESLAYHNISDENIIVDKSRYTITKTRIIASNQQIVRIDEEDTRPFDKDISKQIEKVFLKNIDNYNTVIISDYAKGIITESFAKKIISVCNKKNIYVLVDPAIKHFSFYKKATLMTPNLKEAIEGMDSKLLSYNFDRSAVYKLGKDIVKKLSLEKLIITLSANGMGLFDKNIKEENYIIPTRAKEVFDVSGAGDTVISVLAMCMSIGFSFIESAQISNIAAGIVVGKKGTSTLTIDELMSEL